MTIQQLRDAHRAAHFQPFTIHMPDGHALDVPHPEFLSMSPSGRTVIIYHEDDHFSILDLLLITEIEMKSASSSPA